MSVLRRLVILTMPIMVAACNPSETVANEGEKKETAKAEQVETAVFDEKKLRTQFEKMGVTVTDIAPATIAGLVEVNTSRGMIFSSLDGTQFIAGTLYGMDKTGNYVDILAERQAPLNAEMIEKFSQEMIVYPAENEKYVITVFTDTTCGYCVRLHHQMQGYNELGITVRYLAYPRQGPTSSVGEEMARIWCAEDPKKAMDQSKSGQSFTEQGDNIAKCSDKILKQYALGRDLGITGTPAVFLPNGKLVAGYMPPAGMFQRLKQEMEQ